MKNNFLFLAIFVSMILLISCDGNWPYKPEQFIPPKPPEGSFVSKTELQNFLGTTEVSFTYTYQVNGVAFVNFVNFADSVPSSLVLKKPAGREDWDADSPLLSPNGKLVTYYLFFGKQFASYVQALDSTSSPILVSEHASDPHFFRDSSQALFITYADTSEKLDIILENLFTNATWKQQINPSTGQKIGEPKKIADKPMYGGLSSDGKYLSTGYTYAYIYNVNAQKLEPINTGLQTCNPSTSPDSVFSNRMMFLNIQGIQNLNNNPYGSENIGIHQTIFIVDNTNTVVSYFDIGKMFGNQKNEWQDPEWSNKATYFSALASQNGLWDAYCVNITTGKILLLNNTDKFHFNATSTPSIRIGSVQ